jgi:hypothetical protein
VAVSDVSIETQRAVLDSSRKRVASQRAVLCVLMCLCEASSGSRVCLLYGKTEQKGCDIFLGMCGSSCFQSFLFIVSLGVAIFWSLWRLNWDDSWKYGTCCLDALLLSLCYYHGTNGMLICCGRGKSATSDRRDDGVVAEVCQIESLRRLGVVLLNCTSLALLVLTCEFIVS